MKRRQFLTAAAATAPLVAGCTGGGSDGDGGGETPTTSPGGTTTAQSSADEVVVMRNTAFQTLKAQVDAGATVRWVNEDGFAHTVTSAQFHDAAASWSFDERVSAGGRVTHTFDQKGVYEYYCTIHGKNTMCGAVLVGGATLNQSLPCAGEGDDGGGGGLY